MPIQSAGAHFVEPEDDDGNGKGQQPELRFGFAECSVDEQQGHEAEAKIFCHTCQRNQRHGGKEEQEPVLFHALEPQDDGPHPKAEHHHIAHHAGAGDQKARRQQGEQGREEVGGGKTLGEAVGAEDDGERGQQEGEVQDDLAPAHNLCDHGEVIAGQGRVLSDAPHGFGIAIPVHREAVGVEGMGLDLAGGPEEERVIHVKRLGQKQAQHADGDERDGQSRVSSNPSAQPAEKGIAIRRRGKLHGGELTNWRAEKKDFRMGSGLVALGA